MGLTRNTVKVLDLLQDLKIMQEAIILSLSEMGESSCGLTMEEAAELVLQGQSTAKV